MLFSHVSVSCCRDNLKLSAYVWPFNLQKLTYKKVSDHCRNGLLAVVYVLIGLLYQLQSLVFFTHYNIISSSVDSYTMPFVDHGMLSVCCFKTYIAPDIFFIALGVMVWFVYFGQ